MTEPKEVDKCSQCHQPLQGPFCMHCGHPKTVSKINSSYLLAELRSLLNFEKGLLFTIGALLLRPGASIRNFIHEDRRRLVKPILFVVFCSLVSVVFQQLFQFERTDYNRIEELSIRQVFEWLGNNQSYAYLILSFFFAFWTKVLFRKYNYNYYETLVLILFVIGMVSLIYLPFEFLEKYANLNGQSLGNYASAIYMTWAIGQFFDERKFKSYLKSFLAIFLGSISFILILVLLGILMG